MVSTVIVAPESSPPRHGLTWSVTPRPDSLLSDRWENGFEFVPENCTEPESWVAPCNGAIAQGAAITDTPKARIGDAQRITPFVLRAEFECDTASIGAIDFEQRATRILESGTSKAIETELSDGLATGAALGVDANPHLTNHSLFTEPALGAGVATTPRLAIIALIQAAARAAGGSRATIHATPATVEGMFQTGSLVMESGLIFTRVGHHQVIAGSGYTGHGDNNTPNANNDEHWAYITSPIQLMMGEVQILGANPVEGMDRVNNDLQVIAQRTAAVFFDGCLHTGINVDTMGSAL